MNSILNSISSGELQVQQVPEVKPVKEDSIIDLLQNSEIEFELQQNPLKELKPVFEEIIDFKILQKPVEKKVLIDSVDDLLQNSEIELNICPEIIDDLQNINTGFGKNNDLHFEDKCKPPELKTPLYLENYFKEFVTEEEKAAARHALGLYNKDDIVAMSLLTAEDSLPSQTDLLNASIKQLRKGDTFFTPFTLFNSVYNHEGITLSEIVKNLNSSIADQQKEISKINQISNSDVISSLGDVKLFLQGFNNNNNLNNILNDINKDMIKFEKTGQII